jgi:gamma-glutamyltranspeptidase/glutathione hydrolase
VGAVSRGTVAAGHPATAEAGAWALREGGNAVDAAIAAVLASVSAESPLTGLGAGGHLLVHGPGTEPTLLDFFVAAPGLGGEVRGSDLVPVEIKFGDVGQVFNVGAASCGVPGVPSGLAAAAERFGSMPLAELVKPGVSLARDGLAVSRQQAYLIEILAPILTREPAGAAIYAPRGTPLREGERIAFAALAETLERFGEEGPEPFYRGDVARAISESVQEGGGYVGAQDLASYETVTREPARARYRGREILTNPPPSSGGILVALALELLDRLGASDPETLVAVMEQAQGARTREFLAGLYEDGFLGDFLTAEAIDAAADRCRAGGAGEESDPGDRLGSTTHITAIDAEGGCAAVTCSNGSGSGVFAGDTGIQLNNMLGEADLNPFGFHATPSGRRMPSMMSPTVVLRDGELELGLGSGGSNRIRSAITQTIVRCLADGLDVGAAVAAPRLHFEAGEVHAEPGVPEDALRRLEARGHRVVRWPGPNLFFGGVHAVGRHDGVLSGGGDPRRGGAVAVA